MEQVSCLNMGWATNSVDEDKATGKIMAAVEHKIYRSEKT